MSETLKKCATCKTEKPKSEYNKNKAKTDGLQSHCRPCSHQRFKQYYASNKAHHRKVVTDRNKKRTEENRSWLVAYLIKHSCSDCCEDDIIVLEFDHTSDDKLMDVSKMVSSGYSIQAIEEEIAKCDVVCANCHRRRTARRSNNYRHRAVVT